MRMPSRGATLTEVHHAAVIVRRIPGLNDGLTRPGNRSCPPFDPLSAFHWDIRYVLKPDHLHDDSPPRVDGRSRYPKIRNISSRYHSAAPILRVARSEKASGSQGLSGQRQSWSAPCTSTSNMCQVTASCSCSQSSVIPAFSRAEMTSPSGCTQV